MKFFEGKIVRRLNEGTDELLVDGQQSWHHGNLAQTR